MVITAKINDTETVKLCDWNTQMFESDLALKVQSDDFTKIKNLFTDINKIEILIDDEVVATYTAYNTYSEIQYLGDVYVSGEDIFTPALRVILYKTDIAEQVKRLDEKVNPVINFDTMSPDEYRNYKLTQVNEACQEDIYAGDEIEIDGTPRKFTFKLEDQMNLKNLFDIVSTFPDVQHLPYHVSAQSCEMFSRKDIITVYLTLLIRLTKITTYCNQLNMYIRSLYDKEKIKEITYGMELPEGYLATYNNIIAQSMESMQSLFEKYLGTSSGTEDTGSAGDTENTEDKENAENTENTDSTGGEDIVDESEKKEDASGETEENTSGQESTDSETQENETEGITE